MTGPAERVVERLRELATYGAASPSDADPAGIVRPLFTSAEFAARERFVAWARAAGFALVQDVAGNLFARRPPRAGADPARAPILIGSHLDTVHGGGAYDGAYGVVAALAALETLEGDGAETDHPLEAVAWAGEEGSRFPLGCLGSGAYAGLNSQNDLDRLVGNDGVPFVVAREGPHGLVPDVPQRADFPRPAAYLEVHIEQGPLLETAGMRLGVVTAIAGARRFRVELTGERGHAGTLPMSGRKDALCAAAEVVLALESTARDLGECVATVGYLDVDPNETNVVPGHAVLRVDMRSTDDARTDRLERTLHDVCARAFRERGVAAEIVPLERRGAVPMDPRLRACLHASIAAGGERAIDVPSGAGHDAMCLAAVAPSAMIFVPSVGGRSHVDDEYTAPDDLILGARALARAVLDVDRALSSEASLT